MKNFFTSLLFACAAFASQAQTPASVALKIGSCYFIDCKKTIVFGEQEIMNVSNVEGKTDLKINLDVFSPGGRKIAEIRNSQVTMKGDGKILFQHSGAEYLITDSDTKRVVCRVTKVYNNVEKRWEAHLWADMYLPDGQRFQCTPDVSNLPTMLMMSGATFSRNEVAIQLN